MLKNAPLGIAGLVLLAGSLVLLFFVILSGLTSTTPLNDTYFLRADTSGIDGARDVTQWTYFFMCGQGNKDCGGAHPAPPFGSAWGGSDADGVPSDISGSNSGTSKTIYYLWRFGWVFFLITLFFEVIAFFAGFLACCGRLGAAISGLISMVALFFFSLAAALMTATFVIARNAFQKDDHDASLGKYAFGFVWGAYAALLIATVLFFIGIRGDKSAASSGGRRWGRRTRSTRSRSYDGRRVKDDYS